VTTASQPIPPIVPVIADELTDGPAGSAAGDEDRNRDTDGTPVGRDDLRADVERSGGDPDRV